MMKSKLTLCIFVLFLICPSAYGYKDSVISADKAKTVRWFLKGFQGEWVQIPDTEADLAKRMVLDNSERWAALFLADNFNPYKHARQTERKMFLGVGLSLDKLITVYENKNLKKKITVTETRGNFIITCENVGKNRSGPAKNSNDALMQIQSDFIPMLSEKAGEIVRNKINV